MNLFELLLSLLLILLFVVSNEDKSNGGTIVWKVEELFYNEYELFYNYNCYY